MQEPKETMEEGVARRIRQLMLEHEKLSGTEGSGAPEIQKESIQVKVTKVNIPIVLKEKADELADGETESKRYSKAQPRYEAQIHFDPGAVKPPSLSLQIGAAQAFHDTCNQIYGVARTLKSDDHPETHVHLDDTFNNFKTNMYTDNLTLIAKALDKMTHKKEEKINIPIAERFR